MQYAGEIFMGLMVAGGVAGSIAGNTASTVSNACNQWQEALDNYNTVACKWKNILENVQLQIYMAQQLNEELAEKGTDYKVALSKMKDAFRQQELSTVIGISILIFIILVSFLMRYFNVYGMIWSFIVK